MLSQLIPALKLPEYDQPLDTLINILQVTFTEGNCQVQYEFRLPGTAGLVTKSGIYNFAPPAQLIGSIDGLFKAMLPQMLTELNKPKEIEPVE